MVNLSPHSFCFLGLWEGFQRSAFHIREALKINTQILCGRIHHQYRSQWNHMKFSALSTTNSFVALVCLQQTRKPTHTAHGSRLTKFSSPGQDALIEISALDRCRLVDARASMRKETHQTK